MLYPPSEHDHTVLLEPEELHHRFVEQKLGGYYMQTNKLILEMLLRLGYKAFSAPGRVCKPPDVKGQPLIWGGMSHLVVFVLLSCHLDSSKQGLYVVDVGFGARGIVRPHLLQEDHQERGRGSFEHRYIRAPMDNSCFDPTASTEDSFLPHDLFDSQMLWCFQSREDPQDEWKDNYSFITTETFASDIRGMSAFASMHTESIFR